MALHAPSRAATATSGLQVTFSIDSISSGNGSINGNVLTVTGAGTFDAISMRISMWLDDETFWRFPTSCSYRLLYSPAVRGMVFARPPR